jgi:hypothetical protein
MPKTTWNALIIQHAGVQTNTGTAILHYTPLYSYLYLAGQPSEFPPTSPRRKGPSTNLIDSKPPKLTQIVVLFQQFNSISDTNSEVKCNFLVQHHCG